MPPVNPQSEDADSTERLVPLGRALLLVGLGLLVLRGLPLTARMPGWPSFWYANQPMWIALAIGLTAMGWNILYKHRSRDVATWRPSLPGRRFESAVLYVGEGCHLCEEAAALLDHYRLWLPPIQEVNIRSDTALDEAFCNCIPVVAFDDRVRFRGRINEGLLRRLIEGAPPAQAN